MEKTEGLKAVKVQDVLDCENNLMKLESWQNALQFVEEYFDYSLQDEKLILKQYHASSKLFHIFYDDYAEILKDMMQMNEQMFEADRVTPKEVGLY